MKDRYGVQVKPGDILESSYGIPPVKIVGTVIHREGVLWVLTPGHDPAECKLTAFKRHLGEFEIATKEAQ